MAAFFEAAFPLIFRAFNPVHGEIPCTFDHFAPRPAVLLIIAALPVLASGNVGA